MESKAAWLGLDKRPVQKESVPDDLWSMVQEGVAIVLNVCLRLLADKKSNDRVVNTAAATVRQASCHHSNTAPHCMHACRALPCPPRHQLVLAGLLPPQPKHSPCCALTSCWPCAGTALTRSAACLPCCLCPSWQPGAGFAHQAHTPAGRCSGIRPRPAGGSAIC